jgi:hypothetical protein
MADKFTILIEKALSSNSDAEKLACLKQAQRIYGNQGTAVMPRNVAQPTPAKAEEPTVTLKRHIEVINEIEGYKDNLSKDNNRLTLENTALRTEMLKTNNAADAEVLDAANKKIRNARAVTVAVAVIFVVALVLL